MNWRKYIDFGPVYNPRVTKIPVRQLGIGRVVIVRTKKNGGINIRHIEVKEA